LRLVLSDGEELITVIKSGPLLAERRGIPLLRWLDQCYDRPNVIALDLMIGIAEFQDIRGMDKALDRRMRSALKGYEVEAGSASHRLRIRLVAVIG